MNGLKPNCLDDFLFSNARDRETLELILQRRLPFPFGGKSGILLSGVGLAFKQNHREGGAAPHIHVGI